MTSWKRPHLRIAVEGCSRPATTARRSTAGRVTVSLQAATVLKFFAADVLPAVGRHAAVVEDGVEKMPP